MQSLAGTGSLAVRALLPECKVLQNLQVGAQEACGLVSVEARVSVISGNNEVCVDQDWHCQVGAEFLVSRYPERK